jgi:hypothetical protein
MQPLVERIVRRFVAFKYEPKETKKSKAERIMKLIRDKTGLSRGQSEEIADILVRGRDLEALAVQKNLPVTDGTIEGPKGTLSIDEAKSGL